MGSCLADPELLALGTWLLASGTVGFAAMGIDKAQATGKRRRIPEASLLAISLVGGFWGVPLGAFVFHHKTSKPLFVLVMTGSFVVWIFILSEIRFAQYLAGCIP